MKKTTLLMMLVLVFGLFAVACSGDEASEKTTDQSNTEQSMTDSDMQKSQADSLAGKTFPVRSESNSFVTLVTDHGNMTLELYRDVAPAHADSFLARTRDGFYKGTIFHRIIDHFMIQGGDPQGTGMGNAGYFLPAEFNDLPHQEGTLSAARGPDPNSASCQFFIVLERNRSTASLDGKYTVYGQLIHGYDVLHKIGSVETVQSPVNQREQSKPKEDVYIRDIYESDKDGNRIEG